MNYQQNNWSNDYNTNNFNNYGNSYNNYQPMQNQNQFNMMVDKENGKMAIIALIMAIFSLLLSCCGMYVVGFLPIIGVYCAIKGLKSSKRILSIIALILDGLSVFILGGYILLGILSTL